MNNVTETIPESIQNSVLDEIATGLAKTMAYKKLNAS